MDSKLEKRFRERAVELGNSGDTAALPELIEFTRSPAANVRRLAALGGTEKDLKPIPRPSRVPR